MTMRAAGPDDIADMQGLANRARLTAGLPLDVQVRPLPAAAWEADSRIVPSQGWVTVRAVRTVHDGTRVLTILHSLDDEVSDLLITWAVGRARQMAAAGIGIWVDRGHGSWLERHGFAAVRPFWRMDRANLENLPGPAFPEGHRMVDGQDPAIALETWVEVLNGSFADHWRYAPEDPAGPRSGLTAADRGLHLMALDQAGRPAAVVISSLLETADGRPQPVGYVQQVGTLPAHRRKGLARALTAASLWRLRAAGAASASLNVDARNPARAYDLYRELGFEVSREYDVWSLDLDRGAP